MIPSIKAISKHANTNHANSSNSVDRIVMKKLLTYLKISLIISSFFTIVVAQNILQSINPPLSSNILPLTGFGGDYLITFGDGIPDEVWLTWGWADQAASYLPQYHTSRLGFVFPGLSGQSVLDYTKMDRVLQIFASKGVKVIPCLQNNQNEVNHFVAQQRFIDDWLTFVNHYKNSPYRSTIAALDIFGEPNYVVMQDFSSTQALVNRFAYLIQQIHAIDSTLPVIFPTGQLTHDPISNWINEVKATGITNDSYVYYDVAHPYFFENEWDSGMTPEQRASWYIDAYVTPCVNAFGASKCWVGETFHWGGLTDSLQSRWIIAIINSLHALGVGFDIWCCLGITGYNEWSWTLADVDASNYHP